MPIVVAVVDHDRAVGGEAGGLGFNQAVFRVPCVIPLSVVRHVAVGIIGRMNSDRIDMIDMIGNQGVLVKAVSRVGVGDGVER